MGTIQPSRFLSHTGKILPGVRRVFVPKTPASGAPLFITVPGGVQWWVSSGFMEFVTGAAVGNRTMTIQIQVDGLLVYESQSGFTQVANTTVGYQWASTSGFAAQTTTMTAVLMTLPDAYLPEGSLISISAAGTQNGDVMTALAMWIEEVYVTDPQLSEIARVRSELDREIAAYEYEQATAAQGG